VQNFLGKDKNLKQGRISKLISNSNVAGFEQQKSKIFLLDVLPGGGGG
jgi:hypothetical protein